MGEAMLTLSVDCTFWDSLIRAFFSGSLLWISSTSLCRRHTWS